MRTQSPESPVAQTRLGRSRAPLDTSIHVKVWAGTNTHVPGHTRNKAHHPSSHLLPISPTLFKPIIYFQPPPGSRQCHFQSKMKCGAQYQAPSTLHVPCTAPPCLRSQQTASLHLHGAGRTASALAANISKPNAAPTSPLIINCFHST